MSAWTGALAELRRAIVVAHALPACCVSLETEGAEPVCFGFRGEHCLAHPCALRDIVTVLLHDGSVDQLGPLVGLPTGPVRVRLLGLSDDQEIGLGVYRYRTATSQGFAHVALAALAPLEQAVRGAVAQMMSCPEEVEASALAPATVRLSYDPGLGAALVLTEFPPLPLLPDGSEEEAVAIRIAAASFGVELVAELEGIPAA